MTLHVEVIGGYAFVILTYLSINSDEKPKSRSVWLYRSSYRAVLPADCASYHVLSAVILPS